MICSSRLEVMDKNYLSKFESDKSILYNIISDSY